MITESETAQARNERAATVALFDVISVGLLGLSGIPQACKALSRSSLPVLFYSLINIHVRRIAFTLTIILSRIGEITGSVLDHR